MDSLRIDESRFASDFEALARVGSTGDGGVNRPALGEAHLEARAWLRRRIQEAGLVLRVDGAGNHSAVLRAADAAAPTLLLGSHLDSVAHGGRFDGALGVVAALEVLRTLRDADARLPVHLEAIDFTDEEGTLVPLLGSRAFAGQLAEDDLARARGGRERLDRAFQRAGLEAATVLDSRRDPASLAGFLELHIEQGPRLRDAGFDVGIVSSIVGIGACELVFGGRADHAGTTPLGKRCDAGLGAASLIVAADTRVRREFQDCVINFGWIELAPGARNVVPASARLALEYRSSDPAALRALEAALLELARRTAAERGLALEIRPERVVEPVRCSPDIRRAFSVAAGRLGLRHRELSSGAGHDTMALAAVCPAGMAFVPSSGGSHSPREFAEWQACVKGANLLLQAALERAREAAG